MRIMIRTKDSATLTRDIYTKSEAIELAAMCNPNETVAAVDGRSEIKIIAKEHPILGVCVLGSY